MSKNTVPSNPLSNAAALLALLISRGIIRYATISDVLDEEKKDDVDAIRKILLKRQSQQTIDGKKITKKERNGLTTILTQINEEYPNINPDDEKVLADSDIARNITALTGINLPTFVTIPDASVTLPHASVTLPRELATNMQNEIFTRRRETTELRNKVATKVRAYKIQKGKAEKAETRLGDEKALVATRDSLIGELNNNVEALQLELETKRKEADEYKRDTQQLQEHVNVLLREGKIEARKSLETEIDRRLKESKKLAVEYKKIEAQQKKIQKKITETQQIVRDESQQTQRVINTGFDEFKQRFEELKVASTIKGNIRQKITPEKKEGKERESKGLGLSPTQRTQLKQIITAETNAEYANVVDMIAGDGVANMTPYDLTSALIGLGLSVAVPIPRGIYDVILQRLGRESGFRDWFNNLFETQNIDGDNIVLEQKNNVRQLNQVEDTIPASITGVQKEDKQAEGPGTIDRNLEAQQQQQQRDNRGRFARKMQATIAITGLTTYAVTGSTPTALVGAGAGALAVAAYPAINKMVGPAINRIGDALAERMPDTIPTTTGIKRAVQRQITTDTKDVNIPILKVARRTANEQETTITYNRLDELNNEYNDLINRQQRLEADMMSNINSGVSNTQLGLTYLARSTSQQIRENRDTALRLQDDIDNARLRVDIDRKGIPIPRRTTDEEKALVPFNEAEERTTYDKKKALAVAGAVGGAVVAGGIAGSGVFKERPIEVPSTIYSQQQGKEFDTAMPNMARGLLRPKFIMPDADILQPSNQELAADALEFAMFDFVEPSSEGAEGTNQTNILKAFQKENENIRYRGAGVVVNSLFNNDANDLTREQITKMFLGPPIPPMVFTEIQQNLSEYEVNQFDVNNEITGIEFFSPYNNFTDVNPGLNENISMLFDVVP